MKKLHSALIGLAIVGAAGAGAGATRWSMKVPVPMKSPEAASTASSTPPAEPMTFVGVLLPPKMANVAPKADGKLVAVGVRVGQVVREGDVLATFDARERKNDLAMAEAQLKQALGAATAAGADLAAARKRASRRNATVDVGGRQIALVSGEEATQSVLDAHGAGGRAAQAAGQVAEQRARVAQLKLALEETELRAPYAGTVTAIYFEPGMSARAAETVVRVVGGGRGLRVRIAIPEEAHGKLPGVTRARLVTDDGRALGARIDRLSPEIDAASRTYLAEGTVDGSFEGSEGALLAGRTVRATLTREDGSLAMP